MKLTLKLTRTALSSSCALILALGAMPAAADVITTMTATGGTRFFTDARDDPANLIGPGITEVNPSDVTSWTHENSTWSALPNAGWFSSKGSTPIAFVEFDLGGTYTVSDAHIWNYNGAPDITQWNAVNVTLIFSEDATFGNGDDSSQNLTLSPASGLTTYTGEHFSLTSVADVTNIRLEITSAGPSSITGLSEVRFSGTIAGPDGDPPVISTLSPADDATGVAPSADLVATFDEDIALKNGGTVTIRNLGPSPDADEVITIPDAGRLSVLDNVLTINPMSDLDTGNNYAVQISNDAIEDLAASPNAFNGISDDATWNFTTAAPDTTAPMISTLSPADDATGVGPTTNLLATFDEDVALTGAGTITVTDITDNSSSFTIDLSALPDPDAAVSVSGAELTIDPASALDGDTAYAVQISADAIEDLSGNDFAGILNNNDWSFTTGGTSVVITPVSVTPSTEWSATPGTGAASNLLGPGFTQNDPIETSTHGNSEWSAAPAEGWFQWNADAIGATLDFDLGGTFTIEKAHIWNWNGNGGGNPSYEDWGTKDITLRFSQDAVFGNGDDTTQSVVLNMATGQLDYTGDHFALTPVAGVTHIRLEVVSSLPGNNGITALAEVRFSGSVVPDTDAPMIATLGPADDATGVAPATNLLATFDESIVLTGAGTITVTDTTNGTGTFTIDLSALPDSDAAVTASGTDLTIDPTAALEANTSYAVQISADAIADPSGNAFAGILNNDDWSFTTGNAASPPAWVATWPQVDGVTASGGTARARIDEDGMAYFVVLSDGAPAPSSSEVKAGTGAGGSSAIASGSIALTNDVEGTSVIGGLTAETAYDVYFVAEDDEPIPSLQASPVEVGIATPSIFDAWGGGVAPGDDANGDGVANGMAFLLGAADPNENATGRLPTASADGSGGLVLMFDCLPVANRGGMELKVAHSSDLGVSDAWSATPVVPDTSGGPYNGVTFVVDTVSAAPLNRVTAAIGAAEADGGRLFGRLQDFGSPSSPTPLLSDIRAGETRKVVTIGTSLTSSAWPGLMQTWLKSEAPDPNNVTVVNLGIGASNSQSGGINILADIKAQNPDTVFMEFSINDAFYASITQQISADNHNFIINDLRAHNPDIEIIIQTMNNPIDGHLTARPEIAAYYQVARDVAAAQGLLLIDHYPNWLNLYNSDPTTWDTYVPDGIHPNSTGHQNVMIPEMQAALEAAAP